MNDVDKMLAKQFLLRVRQEGYSLVENPPQTSGSELNTDIYKGETKICTFDDRQLGERWSLRVREYDSTYEENKHDFYKLHDMFIYLRDLFVLYENAVPLQGYEQSLGFRTILQHNNCTLAVKGFSSVGELEFGTFFTRAKDSGYGSRKITLNERYYDMDNYPAAKLDFIIRSRLLPREQLITPENIKYLHGACSKTMAKEGDLFDEDTKKALNQVITGLEKVQDSFREVIYLTAAIPAQNAQYIETKTFAVKGIFTRQQIDRDTVPKGMFAYDIQHSREELKPERVWNRVLGRRFGTVITKKPLTIGENGYTELGDKDFSLNPEKHYTLKQFQMRNREAR